MACFTPQKQRTPSRVRRYPAGHAHASSRLHTQTGSDSATDVATDTAPRADVATARDAGLAQDADGGTVATPSGCGCRTAGAHERATWPAGFALAAMGTLAARRRRSHGKNARE